MSKTKAIICTVLLMIVVLILLVATINIEGVYGINLFDWLTAIMAGCWLSDRTEDFYKWLQKK